MKQSLFYQHYWVFVLDRIFSKTHWSKKSFKKGGKNMLKQTRKILPVMLVLFLCLTAPVYAVDGVIEINHARALAGGVTLGDAPGYPVTIDQSGSYRLTGNLTVPEDTDGIKITTDDVTIDLNGFTIAGSGSFIGQGVSAPDRWRITVRNGVVRGMGDDGVRVGPQALIQNILAANNLGDGIRGDAGCTVTGNIASNNRSGGIQVWRGCTVTGNTARDNINGRGIYANDGSTVTANSVTNNGDGGIFCGSGCTVTGNTAADNSGNGIVAGDGSLVTGNSARSNKLFGLSLSSHAGYGNNVLRANTSGEVSGGIQIGTNVCGNDTICP